MSVAILSEDVVLDDDFVVRLQSADLPGLDNSATGSISFHDLNVSNH